MASNVAHFEIMGPDGPALRSFYGDLFDWSFQTMEGMDYGLVNPSEGEPGVGGGVGTNPAGQPLVTVYVTIDDDPQAYLDRVVAMGGGVVMPPTKGPGDITFALFSDPQGNVVGVVKGA